MNPAESSPLSALAIPSILSIGGYVLIVAGLIGSVVPIVPGPFIIWLGALLWAWGDGFEHVGWPTLILLLVLALAAWASDFAINTVISRRAGASWKAIMGAIVGGIAGGIFLSVPIPVLGTLIGAALGAMLGALLVEYLNTRNLRAAWVALKAYLGSMVLASLLEVVIALLMVSLFAWQAFLQEIGE